MKRSSHKLAAAVALALIVGNVALADPFTGSIGFVGMFSTDNNSDFTQATKFTSFTAFTLAPGTGAYSSVGPWTSVAFTPFAFSATGVTPLWDFTYLGTEYSFDATTVSVSTTANSIIAQGHGIANITGYTASSGTWSITGNSSEGLQLTFLASTNVSEGSTTAVLLGLSLVGLSLFARWRKPARS